MTLELVFALWILSTYPAFAGVWVYHETESGLTPIIATIPIGDPAHAVQARASIFEPTTGHIGNNFKPQFFAADDVLKRLDDRSLHVDRRFSGSQNLTARLDSGGWGIAIIEAEKRGANVISAVVRNDKFNSVDMYLGAVSSVKLLASEFQGPPSGPPQHNSGNEKKTREKSNIRFRVIEGLSPPPQCISCDRKKAHKNALIFFGAIAFGCVLFGILIRCSR